MLVIKYDDESYFKEFDDINPISNLIWTGVKEQAKQFDEYASIELMSLIEILIDEDYVPFTIEKY